MVDELAGSLFSVDVELCDCVATGGKSTVSELGSGLCLTASGLSSEIDAIACGLGVGTFEQGLDEWIEDGVADRDEVFDGEGVDPDEESLDELVASDSEGVPCGCRVVRWAMAAWRSSYVILSVGPAKAIKCGVIQLKSPLETDS